MEKNISTTVPSKGKYDKLINILAFVAMDSGSYVVIDRIVRAYDRDTIEQSIYEAIRYIFTDIRKCTEFEKNERSLTEKEKKKCFEIKNILGDYVIPENEINTLLEEIERGRLSIVRRIAVQALSKALSIATTQTQPANIQNIQDKG